MIETSSKPLKSVLLIGAHDSGKSNFLFRLWMALDSGQGLLVKAGLPEDLDYLKTGANHLLKGEFAVHTSQEVYDSTEIPVKSKETGPHAFSGTLVVPDLPGEQIPAVYRSRKWSSDWEDRIQPGCSCLIFVRIDSKELIAPLDWISCMALFGAAASPFAANRHEDQRSKPPTQVVLVDWLQFLREAFTNRVGGEHIPRVGIVVTAWDLAPNEQKPEGPESWIASNLPMLSQFVETNDTSFEFEFFAVSIASGDFVADPDFKSTYMDGEPHTFGEVVHSLGGAIAISNDMTLPVAWALGLTESSESKKDM